MPSFDLPMIKHHFRILLVAISSIFLLACRGERWDDDLTLPQQDYTGNEIRIDGYYYNFSDNRYSIFFYYRDGTRLYGDAPLAEELTAREQSFADGSYYELVKDSKTNWGRFVVNGSEIKAEFWPPSTGGGLEAWTHSGTILNDTTFQMTKAWRSCKPKKKNDFNEIWHFKKFSPKPDSSNSYTN